MAEGHTAAMNLFGKKRAAPIDVRPPLRGGADAPLPSVATHFLTLDLSRAMELAAMLASSRAASFIEIPDLLAGLYMYEWDRIAGYWPEENREQVEEMLRDICQISPQRWNYWIQLYDAKRRESEPQSRWQQFGKSRQEPAQTSSPVPSAALRAVFEAAEVVSPFRDPLRDTKKTVSDEDATPVLTTECLILAIAKYTSSETGRKLRESGLNIRQLENATLDPRRSPLR
jgi:hypothetical protein